MTVAALIPASRSSEIDSLISSVDRYNPSNCQILEQYLQQQLASDTYDLASNLALLKLYQFNPSLCSPDATLSILFLTLSHAPFQPDFTLAWALLSDSFVNGADATEEDTGAVAERKTAERLRELSGLLLARKFKAFWSTLRSTTEGEVDDSVKGLLASADGFEQRLRTSIAQEVVASFKGLKRSTLESFLGLEAGSPALQALVESEGWSIAGEEVKFPKNDSNSPASSVTNEKITIDQLSRLLTKTQA